MNCTESRDGRTLILQIDGRLDSNAAGDFEKKLRESVGAGDHRVVIDCSALVYVSSAGLRTFLCAAKLLRAQSGKLVLASPTPQVREILDLAGFSSILTVCDTREKALETVSA